MTARRSAAWLAWVICLGFTPVVNAAPGAATVRFGVTILPPSWGNPYRGNGTPGTLIWYALFDALTRVDARGELAPALAKRWSAESPLAWRFELRHDVRFSNGRPLDAEAVAATLTWLASAAGRRTVVGNELRGIAGVEVIDPWTLRIETREPDAILPKRLAAMMIVEPGEWLRLGPEGFGRAPVGTGPFVLESWGETEKLSRLVANRTSWRRPRVERLEFRALPDYAVRLQALLSQEIDLTDVAVDDLPLIEHRGLRSVNAPAMQVMSVAFIVDRDDPGPLRDGRVRQALNHAVDKELINHALLGGLGVPASQPASRVTPGHNPSLDPYEYDPSRARALLAEAGYAAGFHLDIDIAAGITATDTAIYQTVAQFLEDVGIAVTLRSRPFSIFIRNYLTGNWQADALGLSWNAAPYNDVARPMEYFSCRKRNPLFCDETLAAALAAANAEFDVERRREMLQKLAAQYRAAAPALFLVETVDVYAMHPRLRGLELANRVPVYEALSVESDPGASR